MEVLILLFVSISKSKPFGVLEVSNFIVSVNSLRDKKIGWSLGCQTTLTFDFDFQQVADSCHLQSWPIGFVMYLPLLYYLVSKAKARPVVISITIVHKGSTKPASQREAVDASASSPHPRRARSREKGNATVCRDLLAHCAAQIDCIFCGFAHTLSSGKPTAACWPAGRRGWQAGPGQAWADGQT